MEPTTTKPQNFRGVVVKTAMKDTATVAVSRYVKHPKYKKYQVRTKKFLVHDPEGVAKVGEQVTIVACRPISKMKRFKIASATAAV
ncbi:30S ribosomal protein S17 [Patescibacteria group bacterium]|nr:30S ribosomal protein S17 [Patescibacteria group bacterium]